MEKIIVKRIIFSIILISVLALNASSALAAFSTADATIDWSEISSYLSDSYSLGTWGVTESFVETSLDGMTYENQLTYYFSTLFQTDNNAKTDVLAGTLEGVDGAFANVGDGGYGYAYSEIYGEFTPDSDYTGTISFDYELFGELEGDGGLSDSYVFFILGDAVYEDHITLTMSGKDTISGIASVTVSLEAGQTYALTIGTGAQASAVPIPSGLWIMGSGLLGILGLMGRKN